MTLNNGFIKNVVVYLWTTDPVTFQIWQPTGSGGYDIRHQVTYSAPFSPGEFNIEVSLRIEGCLFLVLAPMI